MGPPRHSHTSCIYGCAALMHGFVKKFVNLLMMGAILSIQVPIVECFFEFLPSLRVQKWTFFFKMTKIFVHHGWAFYKYCTSHGYFFIICHVQALCCRLHICNNFPPPLPSWPQHLTSTHINKMSGRWLKTQGTRGGEVLPYLGYLRMCSPYLQVYGMVCTYDGYIFAHPSTYYGWMDGRGGEIWMEEWMGE